jgi:hypothetical protein
MRHEQTNTGYSSRGSVAASRYTADIGDIGSTLEVRLKDCPSNLMGVNSRFSVEIAPFFDAPPHESVKG